MKHCLALLSFILFIIVSCKKIPTDVNNLLTDKVGDMVTNLVPPSNTYIDSFDAVNHDGDTTEAMTVLGSQLTNPYF